jgi:hypothetical protein
MLNALGRGGRQTLNVECNVARSLGDVSFVFVHLDQGSKLATSNFKKSKKRSRPFSTTLNDFAVILSRPLSEGNPSRSEERSRARRNICSARPRPEPGQGDGTHQERVRAGLPVRVQVASTSSSNWTRVPYVHALNNFNAHVTCAAPHGLIRRPLLGLSVRRGRRWARSSSPLQWPTWT